MGHALNGSLQDVLIRWHRMRGFDTLWQPGYDHAGISTQNVVEKQLVARGHLPPGDRPRGLRRADVGAGSRRRAGRSWPSTGGSAPRSTTRASASRWTTATSRRSCASSSSCWERGWIYRANRIVNWCPFHETAISDLEVVHERDGRHARPTSRYPFADGDGATITIATVRPATILADVAVAVHPEDERYRDAVGREVVVPFVERRVPVIADERVEPEFGTGALKVTPGHDPIDFEIGARHGLPELTVIGLGRPHERGRRRARRADPEGGRRGRRRLARGARPAREARALPPQRRHLRALPHRASSRSSRCSGGVAMEEPRKPALAALASGASATTPSRSTASPSTRSRTTPDWNVSRQLWWGHQLPIWYCPDGHATVRLAAARRLRRVRLGRARARPRRARHVVLVGALAVRDARLAGRHRGPRAATTRATSTRRRGRSSASGRTG